MRTDSVVSTIPELLNVIAGRGGRLTTENDRLEYVGPADGLDDETRGLIRANRDDLFAWLRTPAEDLPIDDKVAMGWAVNLTARVVSREEFDALAQEGLCPA